MLLTICLIWVSGVVYTLYKRHKSILKYKAKITKLYGQKGKYESKEKGIDPSNSPS